MIRSIAYGSMERWSTSNGIKCPQYKERLCAPSASDFRAFEKLTGRLPGFGNTVDLLSRMLRMARPSLVGIEQRGNPCC
jgi:hypothetical protein